MAEIEENIAKRTFSADLSESEIQVILHRLAPEGTWFSRRAARFLPENDEEIARNLADKFRMALDHHSY